MFALATLALAACLPQVPAVEPSLETKLLATIPDSLAMQSPPMPHPDGSSKPSAVHAVFSPDGKRVAYVAWKGSKSVPVIGDAVSKDSFDYVSWPVFSANGATVGFRAGNSVTKSTEHWWVYSENGKSPRQDWMGEIAALPQGGFAYWIQPGAKVGDSDRIYTRSAMLLVIGSEKTGKYDDADTMMPPSVSADGAVVATTAMKKGMWFPLKVGKKEQVFGDGYGVAENLVLSRDGKRIAYEAMARDARPASGLPECTLYIDEQPIKKGFDAAGCAVFSNDAKVVAYKVRKGAKLAIATTAAPEPKDAKAWFDFVATPVFSADGKVIAYAAAEGAKVDAAMAAQPIGEDYVTGGAWFVVVAGEPLADRHERVLDVALSSDGKHVAYAARDNGRWSIVVDGVAGDETYDAVGPPAFATDGTKVAFGARKERELWWIARDVK